MDISCWQLVQIVFSEEDGNWFVHIALQFITFHPDIYVFDSEKSD